MSANTEKPPSCASVNAWIRQRKRSLIELLNEHAHTRHASGNTPNARGRRQRSNKGARK